MEWTLKNIVVLVIITFVAVVLIISLFGPKIGLLNVAAKLGVKMGEWFLPTKPSEKLKPVTEEDVSEELRNSYYRLINALRFGVSINKTNCLIKFKGFPDDFKDSFINIFFIEDTKETKLEIDKQEVLVDRETIKGIVPCTTTKNKLDMFNKFTEIKILKKDKFGITKILGEDSNLLYKHDNQHICFLENCDEECVDEFTIDRHIVFCNGLEQERWNNVFFEKTYYGNKDDWKFKKENGVWSWRYSKPDADKRVPEIFKEKGLTKQEFNKIFGFTFPKGEKHSDPGIWYKGKYYGEKDEWCYKDVLGRDYWETTNGRVDDKKIYVWRNNILNNVFGLTEDYGKKDKPC